MSSTYCILCLSHDPATTTSEEYDSPAEAEAAITSGITGHPQCDLLIGRYSYPLIEVGCPPNIEPRRAGQGCHHSVTEWVGADWLRLLAAAYQSGDGQMRALACDRAFQHDWPWGRLLRLRDQLGLTMTEGPTP